MKKEINVLKNYEHTHIIRYIGSEIVNEQFMIYLELASEGSLMSLYLKFGPLNEDLVRKYTTQILKGLEFLHEKKIIH